VGIEDMRSRPEKGTPSRGGYSFRARRPHRASRTETSRKPLFRDAFDEHQQAAAGGFLRAGIVIGALFLAASLFVVITRGDTASTVACSIAFAVFFAILALPSLPLRLRYSSILLILFLIGSYLLAKFGDLSSGGAWLCATAALATIFFGLRGGVAVCAAEAVALASIGIVRGPSGAEDYAISSIYIVGLSFLLGFTETIVIGGLRRSIEARGRLATDLSVRQAELALEASKRHDAERRATFLESHDPLTSLPNRDSFELGLARAIEIASGRGRILGVMSIGIDRFRRICEVHGSGAGDALLIETAGRLGRAFRNDDIVARTAGDVFLVLLSDVKNPEDAKSIIDKSRQAFDRSFSIEGAELGLSASFGLALFPNDGTSPDPLIRASETALHLAKADGPGSYRLYDAGLHSRLLAQAKVEGELRGALRSGAFSPWYQPKVDIHGRIAGVEALARWFLPDGGIRLPDEFISMAERSGAIGELGRIVLGKACASAVAWERRGLDPIPISVNLSPYQFRSDEIVKDIRGILGATGLPASRLDLEITESGIMEDQSNAIEKLAELKALGCSISIDDFGTGYSSFSALRDYPVDYVKLPQTFVDPLPGDQRASAIAEAVISLAHRLHFSVVAEGVENEAQFSWLGDANCDQYQGFLFSRPLAEDDFCVALAGGLAVTLK
jgi:diguanylate cyclase (GGDEF)-like protein